MSLKNIIQKCLLNPLRSQTVRNNYYPNKHEEYVIVHVVDPVMFQVHGGDGWPQENLESMLGNLFPREILECADFQFLDKDMLVTGRYDWDDLRGEVCSPELLKVIRKIGEAYLKGKMPIKDATSINTKHFILPLPPNDLNSVVETIGRLTNVKVQHYSTVIRGDLPRICLYMPYFQEFQGLFNAHVLEPLKKDSTDIAHLQQYVKDLLFWRLKGSDYEDSVRIRIVEKIILDDDAERRSIFIERRGIRARPVNTFEYNGDRYIERLSITGDYQKNVEA